MNKKLLCAITLLTSTITTVFCNSESFQYIKEQMGEDSVTVEECNRINGKYWGIVMDNQEYACHEFEQWSKHMDALISDREEGTDNAKNIPSGLMSPEYAIGEILADHPDENEKRRATRATEKHPQQADGVSILIP